MKTDRWSSGFPSGHAISTWAMVSIITFEIYWLYVIENAKNS
jgi:membrane-associated phospholipid phosphatase